MAQPTGFFRVNVGSTLAVEMFSGQATAPTGAPTLRLCTGTNLSATSTAADVTTNELVGANYSGQSMVYSSTTIDNTIPALPVAVANFNDITVTPSGGTWSFQQAAVVASDGTLIGYYEWPSTEVLADGEPRTFTGLAITAGSEGANVSPQ